MKQKNKRKIIRSWVTKKGHRAIIMNKITDGHDKHYGYICLEDRDISQFNLECKGDLCGLFKEDGSWIFWFDADYLIKDYKDLKKFVNSCSKGLIKIYPNLYNKPYFSNLYVEDGDVLKELKSGEGELSFYGETSSCYPDFIKLTKRLKKIHLVISRYNSITKYKEKHKFLSMIPSFTFILCCFLYSIFLLACFNPLFEISIKLNFYSFSDLLYLLSPISAYIFHIFLTFLIVFSIIICIRREKE
jgi:hypothetical protein